MCAEGVAAAAENPVHGLEGEGYSGLLTRCVGCACTMHVADLFPPVTLPE